MIELENRENVDFNKIDDESMKDRIERDRKRNQTKFNIKFTMENAVFLILYNY